MAALVSSLADGSLTGITRWYTQLHVNGCHKCRPAVKQIETLRLRLNRISLESSELPADRLAACEPELDVIDTAAATGKGNQP